MERANNDEEANPYLAMRDAKIARNQKRLRDLGLMVAPPEPSATTPRTKRGEKKKQKPLLPYSQQQPVRRSRRLLSSQTNPDYKDATLPSEKQIAIGRKRARSPDAALDDALSITSSVIITKVRVPSTKAYTPAAPAANSVRSIDLDVKNLVIGTDNDENIGLLGKMMERTGKEFVIHQSFSLASSTEDQQRLGDTRLSFNKYCGVQEWKNSIFLWVNLGTADSPNEFLLEGDATKQITWFGGSRMHDESNVIVKLLHYGKENATRENSNIILWCRRYQPDVKKFTPYVCFGRMGYHSHVPGSRPLSFVWDLLDYDGLKRHSDATVRENFDLFTKK